MLKRNRSFLVISAGVLATAIGLAGCASDGTGQVASSAAAYYGSGYSGFDAQGDDGLGSDFPGYGALGYDDDAGVWLGGIYGAGGFHAGRHIHDHDHGPTMLGGSVGGWHGGHAGIGIAHGSAPAGGMHTAFRAGNFGGGVHLGGIAHFGGGFGHGRG